jgi:hypothetical protein
MEKKTLDILHTLDIICIILKKKFPVTLIFFLKQNKQFIPAKF